MWEVARAFGWIGVCLVAWMVLSVACLCFMYLRGWLSPKRTERIREYEDGVNRGSAATGERGREERAITSIVAPRRAR